MSRLRVNCYSISFDGYSAGPDQSLENPLGVSALQVFNWQFATRVLHQMTGSPAAKPAWITTSSSAALKTSVPGSSAATCSAPSAAPGQTTHGKVGGATTLPTTCPSSFSPTTPARPSLWKEAPPSTSSPTAFTARSASRRRRRRQRCSPRRRRLYHPAISARRPHRRDASRPLPRPHRSRRKHLSRSRSPRSRLSALQPHSLPQRHPHVPSPQYITPYAMTWCLGLS